MHGLPCYMYERVLRLSSQGDIASSYAFTYCLEQTKAKWYRDDDNNNSSNKKTPVIVKQQANKH
jgi:hypothetical protein